jgi:hypothetical protein
MRNKLGQFVPDPRWTTYEAALSQYFLNFLCPFQGINRVFLQIETFMQGLDVQYISCLINHPMILSGMHLGSWKRGKLEVYNKVCDNVYITNLCTRNTGDSDVKSTFRID